jgi:tetratricopeptide (TPR) repeat protein
MTRSLLLACCLVFGIGEPLVAQVDPAQIQEWYDQGNAYMRQELFGTARKQFEKVLDATPPRQRPATLQLVARCFYLEGKFQAAIITLKRAVLLAPTSDVTRQLLVLTMENVEEGDDAREDELQLHRDTANAAPPEPAEPHKVGAFRTHFVEPSPSSTMDNYLDRFNYSRKALVQSDPAQGEYDLDAESFEVFVPESYNPDKPAGLLVWISPASSGGLSRPANLKVLEEENLIWIGANNSGNDRWHWYRTALALDAAHNMQQLYNIDPNRVYIAGYSGGGRVASALGLLYPEVFRGGAYFFGSNYFRPVPVPGKPGTMWRAGFPAPPDTDLERLKTRHSFVLITGEYDFNRDETKANAGMFVEDGFQRVTYIEIPGADHGYGVEGEWLAQVVKALDNPISAQ